MSARIEILFDDRTMDVSSRPFFLYPKTLAIFRAYNMQEEQVQDLLKPATPGTPGTPGIPGDGINEGTPPTPGTPDIPAQYSFKYDAAACLYMLHLEEYVKPPPTFEQEVGGWYPLPESTRIRSEVQVCRKGCLWGLSAKNNINVLDVPGYYRLLLNHVDLVGRAFITAHIFSEQDYPGSKAEGLYYGGE